MVTAGATSERDEMDGAAEETDTVTALPVCFWLDALLARCFADFLGLIDKLDVVWLVIKLTLVK